MLVPTDYPAQLPAAGAGGDTCFALQTIHHSWACLPRSKCGSAVVLVIVHCPSWIIFISCTFPQFMYM